MVIIIVIKVTVFTNSLEIVLFSKGIVIFQRLNSSYELVKLTNIIPIASIVKKVDSHIINISNNYYNSC